ncbi:MAG: ABC transporter permease [Vicinamibacterales bacterium]
MLHDLLGDLRTSMRQLGKTPLFTAAAVTVLALGIGLNAAVFGIAHALVFAGRPFAAPDALVQVYSRHGQEPDSYRAFSYGAFEVLAARRDVFSGVMGHTLGTVGVRETPAGEPRRSFAGFVSASYFDVLGVRLAQGRPFTEAEARPGAGATVAIATHAYWQRTGGRDDLVGATIFVNEQPVTVVGITPPGFTGTMMVFGPELLLPLGAFDALRTESFDANDRTLSDPESFPSSSSRGWVPASTPRRRPAAWRRPTPRWPTPSRHSIATGGSRWRRCRVSAPAPPPWTRACWPRWPRCSWASPAPCCSSSA